MTNDAPGEKALDRAVKTDHALIDSFHSLTPPPLHPAAPAPFSPPAFLPIWRRLLPPSHGLPHRAPPASCTTTASSYTPVHYASERGSCGRRRAHPVRKTWGGALPVSVAGRDLEEEETQCWRRLQRCGLTASAGERGVQCDALDRWQRPSRQERRRERRPLVVFRCAPSVVADHGCWLAGGGPCSRPVPLSKIGTNWEGNRCVV